jgi:hypothetical protein
MQRLTEQQFIEKRTRQLESHIQANGVKDRLQKLGYGYAVSLYGVIFNPESGKHEYRRIEVFLNGLPNQICISEINHFFKQIKPYQYYTIWCYNMEKHEIVLIEGWN